MIDTRAARPDRIPLAEVAEIVCQWPTAKGYPAHIADRYGIPLATAYRWIAEARRRGVLPPFEDVHAPRRARFGQGDSWLACRTCRTPWPCASAEVAT